MIKTTIIILLLLFAPSGCDQQTLREKIIPKEEVEFSKRYLALFQARDFDAIEGKIDPSLKDSRLRSNLEQIAAYFPLEKPTDIKEEVLTPSQTVIFGSQPHLPIRVSWQVAIGKRRSPKEGQ